MFRDFILRCIFGPLADSKSGAPRLQPRCWNLAFLNETRITLTHTIAVCLSSLSAFFVWSASAQTPPAKMRLSEKSGIV